MLSIYCRNTIKMCRDDNFCNVKSEIDCCANLIHLTFIYPSVLRKTTNARKTTRDMNVEVSYYFDALAHELLWHYVYWNYWLIYNYDLHTGFHQGKTNQIFSMAHALLGIVPMMLLFVWNVIVTVVENKCYAHKYSWFVPPPPPQIVSLPKLCTNSYCWQQ